MTTFVESFLKHTQIYESPTSFWKWAGYATIAGILRDNVYHTEGSSRLYPNIYVLFLASSGGRKDKPIRLSSDLVLSTQSTKIISGRASIQAIIDELAQAETDKATGAIKRAGSAIWYAPELSAGIVVDDAAISILTDIYDGKKNFQNLLRHSPKFKVDQIVFSALLGSNMEMIKEIYGARATYGGLLGRTLLITPDEFRPAKSLWSTPEERVLVENEFKCLEKQVNDIAKLRGEIEFSIDAQDEFDKWYHPFRDKYLRIGDKGGINGRIHTSIKKMAMILAADKLNTVVYRIDMEHAIEICMSLLPNYKEFIMHSGKSDLASTGTTMITTMLHAKNYQINRKEFLNEHWQDIDAETFDKTATTLEQGGMIMLVGGNGVNYQLTNRALSKLKGEPNESDPIN